MGQYWRVIAPHDRKIHGNGDKFSALLFDGFAPSLVMQLAVPVLDWIDSDDDPAVLMTSSHGTTYARPPSSPFEHLPTEIHFMIFSHLTSFSDVLFLSMTTRYFWLLGRRYLKQLFTSLLAPLANKATICVGHYAKPLDYPANLLTDDEKAELEAGLDRDEAAELGYSKWRHFDKEGKPRAVNLYDLAEVRYSEITQVDTPPCPMTNSHDRELVERELERFPEPERSQVHALAFPTMERFYPKKDRN